MAATAISATDPLERFPYETWVNIFRYVVLDRPEGPLPYLAVSQKWSQAILEEPELWTSIIIDDSADEDARIYTFLHLSRDHLLDVTVMHPIARLDGIQATLGQGHRIRSLILPYNPQRSIGHIHQHEILQCLHQSVTDYPRMRILDVPTVEHDPWDDLIAKFPNIRVIRGIDMKFATILHSQIAETTIYPTSWDDALKAIHLKNIISLIIDWEHLGGSSEDLARHANRLTEHISWNLKFLDIYMEYPELVLLSPLLFALRGLRTLTVRLDSYNPLPDNWEAPLLTSEEMRYLDNLAIVWGYIGEWVSDRHRESIIKMFTTNKPFRYLKALTLYSASLIKLAALSSLLHSVAGLRRLSLDVRLDLSDVSELNKQPVVMNDLLYLSLSPAIMIDYLEVPNAIDVKLFAQIGTLTSLPDAPRLGTSVSRLSIDSQVFDHINDRWTAHRVATQWTSLQCILFTQLGRCTTVTKISSLRIIDLCPRSTYYVNVKATAMIDGLLQDLLQNHDVWPHLHTIKLPQYPLWEPLFEVLRRRNSSGNSSLNCITLPGCPVQPILSPLVLLLQGRVDVHTLVDVDDLIYRRFTDPKEHFIACIRCAASGYTCCESTGAVEVVPEEDTKTGDLSLLDLHRDGATSSQLHLGSSRREINIEDKIKKRDSLFLDNPRIIDIEDVPCSRHLQAVDIAGFTLDGVSNPYA